MNRQQVAKRFLLFLLVVGVPQAYAGTIATPAGLIAWWAGNNDAVDVSGHNNDAQLMQGAVAGRSGLIGGAFQFDGQNDFVATPVVLPSQGTLDLWVNPGALSSIHGLLGTFGIANGDDRLWLTARGPLGGLGVGADRLVINSGDCCTNEIVVPSPLIIGTWTHLAMTFDYLNDFYALYVDGQVAGFSNALRDAPTQTLDFGAVRSNFSQNFFFSGLLDEIHLFDRVLPSSEILAISQASDGLTPVPEPASWVFIVIGIGLFLVYRGVRFFSLSSVQIGRKDKMLMPAC